MGKVKGDATTDDPVVAEPQETEESGNLVLSALPAWAAEVVNRWRKHDFNDIKLKFDTGAAINKQFGSPKVRATARAGDDSHPRDGDRD